jgi:putative membrane protein
MDEQKDKNTSAREHLANERTLLAWIRTSIGIMAFGFVVVKFSLFVKQITLMLGKSVSLPQRHGYSSLIGISLVVVGGIVLLLSYIKYNQTRINLNNGTFSSSSKLILPVVITILLISIILILYLIENTIKY